jgi:hypothetical protein
MSEGSVSRSTARIVGSTEGIWMPSTEMADHSLGAAHVDIAALALIALDADAGCALQRLGDIGIGEAADRIGRNDGDGVVGGPLLIERARCCQAARRRCR